MRFLCISALIAALYVALTYLAAAMGLASGAIQVRFSEALCILPYFTPAAIPGVTIGCLLSNLLTGGAPLDVMFGTLATLIGAVVARLLHKYKWLVPLPSVLSNMAIIPPILIFVYGVDDAYSYLVLTVGIGEVISIYGIGMILLYALEKRKIFK